MQIDRQWLTESPTFQRSACDLSLNKSNNNWKNATLMWRLCLHILMIQPSYVGWNIHYFRSHNLRKIDWRSLVLKAVELWSEGVIVLPTVQRYDGIRVFASNKCYLHKCSPYITQGEGTKISSPKSENTYWVTSVVGRPWTNYIFSQNVMCDRSELAV